MNFARSRRRIGVVGTRNTKAQIRTTKGSIGFSGRSTPLAGYQRKTRIQPGKITRDAWRPYNGITAFPGASHAMVRGKIQTFHTVNPRVSTHHQININPRKAAVAIGGTAAVGAVGYGGYKAFRHFHPVTHTSPQRFNQHYARKQRV